MKRLLTLISAVLMLSVAAWAQTVSLHLTDGSVVQYDYADIDSIVVDPASHSFTIDVTKIESTSAQVTVACSDPSVRYFFDLCTLSSFEQHNRDVASLVEGFIDLTLTRYPQLTIDQVLEPMLESGRVSEQISRLPADTEMVVYLIAVDEDGHCYGPGAWKQFRTLPGGDPADLTFTIEAEDISSDGCVVHIVPSDPSISYWYGICARDEYPGDVAMVASVKSAFAEAAQENGMTLSELLERVCYKDETRQVESGLQNGTPYYIYAYPLNSTGGNAGTLAKVMFTTTEYDESDAMVSLKYRYFDGDELYDLDAEKYAKYQGAVMVEAVVTPNETAEHWAVALASTDMTDTDTYPDESTKNALLQAGRLDQTNMTYVARWGEATFLYFAADFYGIDGPLRRMLVNFTKSGASPVSTLNAPQLIRSFGRSVERLYGFRAKR